MPQQNASELLSPEPTGSRRGWVIAGLVIVVTSLGLAGYAAYQGQQALIHSHTLAMGRFATGMVQDFVETHDGRWPRSWEELAKNQNPPQISPSLRQRVIIDFDADPAALARQRNEEFIAISPVQPPSATYRDYWQIESLLETLRKYHPPAEK